MEQFCKALPKIELHAHLNGSLSSETLMSLGCLEDNIKEYQKLTKLLTNTSRSLDDCFQLFDFAHQVTNNGNAVYEATRRVIHEFHIDGVVYLELRTTPREGPNMNRIDYIKNVVNAIKDAQEILPIIVKLILCLDRQFANSLNTKIMDIIINMYYLHKDVIVGVDLCGNPKEGQFPVAEFIKARNAGLRVTLHCGEIKCELEEQNMLDFKPDRIGHGTFLFSESTCSADIEQLKALPLEICLSSNVMTGTVLSYDKHHINNWLKHKLPFCLCTDDKGVFLCELSTEYFLANKNYNLTAEELYYISYRAVDYIFAGSDIKQIIHNRFNDWKIINM